MPTQPNYSYNQFDKDALYPEYPDPNEYDPTSVNFRSETRKFARDVYENGFKQRRKVNEHAAVTATELLNQYYEEIYDILLPTTTQHNEKVIIENKKTGTRNAYTVDNFTIEFIRCLPKRSVNKRYYCNCFRDQMRRIVNKVIDETHKMLAGIGIPPRQV